MNTRTGTRTHTPLRRLAVGALAALALPAGAATFTWTAGTSGLWSTATSWQGSVLPVEAATTTITFSPGTVTTNFTSSLDYAAAGGSTTSFDLTVLTLGGSSSSPLTVTLTGSQLNFIGATNTISFNNAGGASGLYYAVNNNIAITNGLTLTGAAYATTGTLNGVISGSGGVTKAGNNIIYLNGINTFSGGLTVNSGRLALLKNNNYTGTTTLNGGTVTIDNIASIPAASRIALNGGTLAPTGASRTLANAVDIGGGVTLIDSYNIQGGNNLTLNGPVDLMGGTRLVNADTPVTTNTVSETANTVFLTGTVANGGLIKAGRGILVLSNTNTYTGDTTVRMGKLVVGANVPAGANGALGNATSAVQLGDASTSARWSLYLMGNTTLTVGRAIAVNSYNSDGITMLGSVATSGTTVFSGDVTLGSGTTGHDVILSATNAAAKAKFTGQFLNPAGLTGEAGSVTVRSSGTVLFAGANVAQGVNLSGAAPVEIGQGNTTFGYLSNAIGTPTVTSAGSGYATAPNVTVSGGGGTGAKAYVTVKSGTINNVVVTNYGTGYTSAPTFTLDAGNGVITGADFVPSSLFLNSGTLTLAGSNTAAASYDGVITGNGVIVKSGAGEQIFAGANSYGGSTTVTAGVLKAGNANAFGTSAITVSGGTLDLSSFNVGNAINITGTGAAVLLPTSSGALTSNFVAGSSFGGWQRQSSLGNGTLARLLGGTAGGSASVTSSWAVSTDTAKIVSDIVDIKGINGTTFVLQLNYADIAGKDNAWEDANATLAWYDTVAGKWVNAVDGNAGGTPNKILGAYDPATMFNLGNWGVDSVNNTVWAVVNHNSEFGVAVPEPAALSLLALGGLALLRRRKS